MTPRFNSGSLEGFFKEIFYDVHGVTLFPGHSYALLDPLTPPERAPLDSDSGVICARLMVIGDFALDAPKDLQDPWLPARCRSGKFTSGLACRGFSIFLDFNGSPQETCDRSFGRVALKKREQAPP